MVGVPIRSIPAAAAAPPTVTVRGVVWSAPLHGEMTDYAYQATGSACANSTWTQLPSFNRSTGRGVYAVRTDATTAGCAYPGYQETDAESDWFFNSSNFTLTGTHRIEALWNLNFTFSRATGSPGRARGCTRCNASASYEVATYIEVIDAVNGVGPCGTLPCTTYRWSVHHRVFDGASNAAIRRVGAPTFETNVTFSRGNVYQIIAGLEIFVRSGVQGKGSTASADLSFGTSARTAGIVLRDVRVS